MGSSDPWTFSQDHPLQRGKEIKFTPFFVLLTGILIQCDGVRKWSINGDMGKFSPK